MGNLQWQVWGLRGTQVATGTDPSLLQPVLWWQNPQGWSDWRRITSSVADLNGDGHDDLVHWYRYDGNRKKLWAKYATGTGVVDGDWNVVWDSGDGNGDMRDVKTLIGDFTGDRRTDLFHLHGYGGLQVKYRAWSGTSANRVGLWGEVPDYFEDVTPVAGDFDGDGKADIVMLSMYTHRRFVLFLSRSTGSAFEGYEAGYYSGDEGIA